MGTDSTCGIGKSWGSTPGSSCVNAKPARSRRLSTQLASLARPRDSIATRSQTGEGYSLRSNRQPSSRSPSCCPRPCHAVCGIGEHTSRQGLRCPRRPELIRQPMASACSLRIAARLRYPRTCHGSCLKPRTAPSAHVYCKPIPQPATRRNRIPRAEVTGNVAR